LSHSAALLVSSQPLPLQSFCALHAVDAPAQLPWPLQALIPAHWTGSDPALSAARATRVPLSTKLATALAIMIPFPIAFIADPPC